MSAKNVKKESPEDILGPVPYKRPFLWKLLHATIGISSAVALMVANFQMYGVNSKVSRNTSVLLNTPPGDLTSVESEVHNVFLVSRKIPELPVYSAKVDGVFRAVSFSDVAPALATLLVALTIGYFTYKWTRPRFLRSKSWFSQFILMSWALLAGYVAFSIFNPLL